MINFIKGLVPNLLFFTGYLLETISRVFKTFAAVFYNISTTLHKELETNTGKQLNELEKSVATILKTYTAITEQVNQNRLAKSQESNKLANIIKDTPANVVTLGKKKDDEPKN